MLLFSLAFQLTVHTLHCHTPTLPHTPHFQLLFSLLALEEHCLPCYGWCFQGFRTSLVPQPLFYFVPDAPPLLTRVGLLSFFSVQFSYLSILSHLFILPPLTSFTPTLPAIRLLLIFYLSSFTQPSPLHHSITLFPVSIPPPSSPCSLLSFPAPFCYYPDHRACTEGSVWSVCNYAYFWITISTNTNRCYPADTCF